MKTMIEHYTFDASGLKVTFTDYAEIKLNQIIGIVNVTRGQTLYKLNNAAYGGTVAGNVLTLTYDTGMAMADTDELYIVYDSPLDVHHPLPVDGDRVYHKDVWDNECDLGDFSGSIADLFDNLHTVIVNSTSTNPKEIFIHFNETIVSNIIGFGTYGGGNFSNIKVYIVNSGNVETLVLDESTDSTKRTTATYPIAATAGFNALRIQFHTADTVSLSNLVIPKVRFNVSRLQAVKPDGTVDNVAMTVGGGLKTAITDNYGFEVENTPMDELRTITPVKLVGTNFEGATIDTNFWTVTNANNGTTTQSGVLTMQTNTTLNGSTIIQSNRYARYTGGSSNRFRAVIQLGDIGVAGNSRKWGLFNGSDGAYFELDDTILYAVTLKASTPTRVAAASWNADTDMPTLTDGNVYEIYITNSRVVFAINGVKKHTVSATSATWSNKVSLPAKISNTNTGISTNHIIYCRVMTIYRLGNLATQPTSKYQSGTTAGVVCKYSTGNLQGAVISGVTNNSVVTLYDNTAATGTVIWSSGTMGSQTIPFNIDFKSLPFANGLTLAITGANCNVLLIYE